MKAMILDAYNVIHKLPSLSSRLDVSLREARRALLNFMVTWKHTKGFKGKVLIVYDGQDNIVNREGSGAWGIECVFTGSKEEADDRIISMIRKSGKGPGYIVISADGRIINCCKTHSMDVYPPSYLLSSKKKKRASGKETRSKSSITGSKAREIDDYYRKALNIK